MKWKHVDSIVGESSCEMKEMLVVFGVDSRFVSLKIVEINQKNCYKNSKNSKRPNIQEVGLLQ